MTGDIITRIQPMNPAIQFQTQRIVIRTRSFLDLVTFGKWRRTVTLDFSQGAIEEEVIRRSKTATQRYALRDFDAVDYSYQLMNSNSSDGMYREHEEFMVGLRLKSSGAIFPLASFRGTASTPSELELGIVSIFPASFPASDNRHEAKARSLANFLCDKLNLELT